MQPLTATLLAIVASGSIGGILLGMILKTSHKIRIPFIGQLLELGFLGDGLVGAGASMAVFFLAAPLLDISVIGERALDQWLKIISLGVFSGILGIKLVTASATHVVVRLAGLEDRVEQIVIRERLNEITGHAESLATEKRFEHALAKYDEALRIDPRSEVAHIGKALVLFNRCKWDEAINTLSNFLETNPSADRAYFDRACYKSASGKYRKAEILQDLKSAITLDPMYKTYAALQNKHFENLRNDEEFRKIVV